MRFDLVLITTGSRPRLLQQSLRSLRENASDWAGHKLTLVLDGCSIPEVVRSGHTIPDRVIINTEQQGASRSRNIGASSTPKYLRQEAVCFFDDDIYCCAKWDMRLAAALGNLGKYNVAATGHAHPYNHTILGDRSHYGYLLTTVLSTVNIACPWGMWDEVGWFQEPGGAGGSEDVDWCKRASDRGYELAVTVPQACLHTGIGSSTGSKLVGWEQVMENNRRLEQVHGIEGKVIYG